MLSLTLSVSLMNGEYGMGARDMYERSDTSLLGRIVCSELGDCVGRIR